MSQDKHKLLCDQFPDHCDLIHRLARENSNFDEIVKDYADVIEVLEKWRISQEPFSESRVQEYQTLRKELESEIEQFLLDAINLAKP
ncbi:MAG: hypothetical protein KJP06_04790 [Deltaproteobacteria bacterium]|nr:hypothetical protein [Deltaproteobacteria bacterium]